MGAVAYTYTVKLCYIMHHRHTESTKGAMCPVNFNEIWPNLCITNKSLTSFDSLYIKAAYEVSYRDFNSLILSPSLSLPY